MGFNDLLKGAGNLAGKVGKATGDALGQAGKVAGNVVNIPANRRKQKVDKIKDDLMEDMDKNNNDEIDVEDVVIGFINSISGKIDRAFILKDIFQEYYDDETIDLIIKTSPAKANIDHKILEKIANKIMEYEGAFVPYLIATNIRVTPPGLFVPRDIQNYYSLFFKVILKYLYLYGFPELNFLDQGIDKNTMNIFIVCLAVMYDIKEAKDCLKKLTVLIGKNEVRQSKAILENQIDLITKNVNTYFVKELDYKIIGAYLKKGKTDGFDYKKYKKAFSVYCNNLKKCLENTCLSNINYQLNDEEKQFLSKMK